MAPESSQDISDSKDVLVQRLLDLASHLEEHSPRDEDITALHHEVDRMERHLKSATSPIASPIMKNDAFFKSFHSRSTSMMSIDLGRGHHVDEPGLPPLSPALKSPISFFDLPRTPLRQPDFKFPSVAPAAGPQSLSPEKASLLAKEAETLLTGLTAAVATLHQRREESEVRHLRRRIAARAKHCQHIHSLLVSRAERAAQRVLELEGQIQELYVHFRSLYDAYEGVFPADLRDSVVQEEVAFSVP
jgi:hypothetical protein